MLTMPQLKKTDPFNRIAIVGKMAAGKTTAATYLVNHNNYTKMALADKLKAIAYEMFDVMGKDGSDRLVLQEIGTAFRKIDERVWIKYLLHNIKQKESQNQFFRVVVDDCRYFNEAEAFRRNGFKIIRVEASEDIRQARIRRLYPNVPSQGFSHASETEQERIVADHVVKMDDPTAFFEFDRLLDDASKDSTHWKKGSW
jgi:dephospho-CoA kinase